MKEGVVLGHVVSQIGVKVDRVKIEIIKWLPPSTLVKGIRSLFGHVGSYHRFIKDFSKITKLIT